jgi:predicted kinase
VPYCAFKSITSYQAGAWPATVLFAVAALAATQLHRFTLSARHRRLAQRLAEIDDIHGVGRLAEALAWPDSEVRDLVAEALTRLLPRLKASDASLLNASQRTSLYQMLDLSNATTYAEFLVALLGALQQIGDRNAVPAVERLAASEPITTRQARVKQAAIECLPYLHQAAEQNQYSQTLLRASSSSNTSSDLLLRSVTTSAVNDEAQLLRAEP